MKRERTPMIEVNRDGIVGMSWYEDRIESDDSKQESHCQELFFSTSVDGGMTFSTPVQVAGVPSCARSLKRGKVEERWPTGGDYTGLQASPDGVFHLVWSDARNGAYQLWTADVKVTKQSGR